MLIYGKPGGPKQKEGSRGSTQLEGSWKNEVSCCGIHGYQELKESTEQRISTWTRPGQKNTSNLIGGLERKF